MPYDQNLAKRIRHILESRPGLIEKNMFGGVGFLLNGNMVCGVLGDDLIVRVGVENNDTALSKPYTRPFGVTGRQPMKGWVYVAPQGWAAEQDLQHWIEISLKYVSTLPEKR
jgi:TfoX/Sxy family transcriptional regulator of competence genes